MLHDNTFPPHTPGESAGLHSHPPGRGRLKLFLGFAAGVGKTYDMLGEANRRKHERRQDVIIGFVETHGRKGTEEQIGDLEQIPLVERTYKGALLREMDTRAIIARKPKWVVIDELAHTNVPGGSHEKRYEDVLDILDAGINVLSAMNVQHLESLNDTVQQITGVKVRETVPDLVLKVADEIVSVDITPRTLINRLQRGDVYTKDKVPAALANFFTDGNLSALREIALREVASEVDRTVQAHRQERGVSEPWQTMERVLVCISPDHPSGKLLRRAWRLTNRLRGEIIAVYVSCGNLDPHRQKIVDADFAFAARLGITVEKIKGKEVAEELAQFAKDHQITQIVIGNTRRSMLEQRLKGSVLSRLLNLVRNIDVMVIATDNQ